MARHSRIAAGVAMLTRLLWLLALLALVLPVLLWKHGGEDDKA